MERAKQKDGRNEANSRKWLERRDRKIYGSKILKIYETLWKILWKARD
jgi:hypothetical protein